MRLEIIIYPHHRNARRIEKTSGWDNVVAVGVSLCANRNRVIVTPAGPSNKGKFDLKIPRRRKQCVYRIAK